MRALTSLPVLVTTIAAPVWGQSPHLDGASVERFYIEEYRFITINYRRTELRQGSARAGLDFVVGLAPNPLAAGVALVQLEAGFARALPVGPGTLLLRGGSSNFLAVGPQSSIIPGLHAGLGAIIPLEKQARVRVDVTRHFYLGLGGGRLAMWSVGLGLAVISPP